LLESVSNLQAALDPPLVREVSSKENFLVRYHCYPRISGKEKLVLGLELADLLILQFTLMALLLTTGKLLITLPVVVFLYLMIRAFKRNKPRFYTERFIRFLMRPRRFNLKAEDKGDLRTT
jgi:hypothetical protein